MIEFDKRPYTNNVVSLWYRAPELLLGSSDYLSAVDMWSVGCIFYELVMKVPPFQCKSETEQIKMIFDNLGPPSKEDFMNYNVGTSFYKLPPIDQKFYNKMPSDFVASNGMDLLKKMFLYDQNKRITAKEALDHDYFSQKD